MQKQIWTIVVFLACGMVAFSPTAQAEVKTKVFGFANVDLSVGNRQGVANGNDSIGVGPLAIGVKGEEDNASFTGVIGASSLSTDAAGSNNPFMAIRDAFITLTDVGGSGVGVSVGPQALLFGLKSNGFPGDRSIRPSLEFTQLGGSGFAVAQQGHPAARAWYELMGGQAQIIAGTFDTNVNTVAAQPTAPVEGSKLSNNYFVAFKTNNLGIDGLYSFIGAENRYLVTASEKGSKPIMTIGAGFKKEMFDISAEWFRLNKNFVGTTDDETIIVAELTVFPWEKTAVYFDYSQAQKLELATYRAGFKRQLTSLLSAQVEWSFDKTKNDTANTEGMDFRLAATF